MEVLVGYASSTRECLIFPAVPETDQIESKHVRFDEDRLGNERGNFRAVNEFDDNDIHGYIIERNKTLDKMKTFKDVEETILKTNVQTLINSESKWN